jgi:uncharacterized protein YbjT (DUF2867 family)
VSPALLAEAPESVSRMTDPVSERVCVAGATGYLGVRVVAAFRARGVPVEAVVKDRSEVLAVERLSALGATIAFADAARFEPYDVALSNLAIAISCMASSNLHVDSRSDFWAIDRDANIRFGLAAISAGARQIVLVATYEGRASRDVTEFSDAKEQAVDAIGDACRAAGVAFTVIRPTAYFSDLTNRAFDEVRKTGQHTVIGSGSHRINPVHGDDVAAFIAETVNDPARAGREHSVGGPDVFTFRQLGELAADVLGKREILRIKSVSLIRLRAMAMLARTAGLVSRKSRRFAAVLRWIIYSGTHDAVAQSCGNRRLRDEFMAKADELNRGSPMRSVTSSTQSDAGY